MSHLLPCDGCDRHVRADEPECPFCGAAIVSRPAPVLPAGRLGRAATFAFGAALAAATAGGCGDSHDRRDDGGEPPADSGVESDAGVDPVDSGVEPIDSGPIAPPYGAPPSDGGPAPLYGGAPDE